MKVLFSCTGTSDPVRGYRDGPLLHIIRHYRPERVVILQSKEEAIRDKNDDRLNTVFAHIREHWDGYSPELRVIPTQISDPSDMDAVSNPIKNEVLKLAAENPKDELLLNISSGTPQMNTVLVLLATDMRYNTVGVQVKSPEGASGKAPRTNDAAYSVLDELACNEDELANAENRCSEPQLLHIQRQNAKEQILALLRQRNYSAIYAMKNSMPDQLKALVGHLEARDRLQTDLAWSRVEQLLPLPFLGQDPRKKSNREYDNVREMYLVLLNRQHRQQYEELVLRLNPLVVRLQLRLMQQTLKKRGLKLGDIITKAFSARPIFCADKLNNVLPDVYEAVSSKSKTSLRDGDVSIALCQRILEQLPGVPEEAMSVLKSCEKLNEGCRNDLAHQLSALSREQFSKACGMEPAQLLNRLGELIALLYDKECGPKAFSVYLECGKYIEDNLN